MLILRFIWEFIYYTWWVWALLILFPLAKDTWRSWRTRVFEHNVKWVLFEVKIPREIKTSPRAMEQIFAQIYNFRNYPGNIKEWWWIGEVTLWHSFEVVGMDGEVHFYLRSPRAYRDLVEAAVFAFYTDIELVETEDYMKRYPSTLQGLYHNGYKLWGTELVLKKSAAYPIRSYEDFEAMDEEKQYDPMSAFIELLSKLKTGQFAGIQILVYPAMAGDPHDKHAAHEYQEEIIKVRERKNEHGPGLKPKLKFQGIFPTYEAEHTVEPEVAAGLKKAIMSRTPGETDVLKAMDENLSRPMFNTVIRYVYISPLAIYSEHLARRAILGSFNQYNAEDLNGFKANKLVQTRGPVWEPPYIFPETRKEFRRQQLWFDYRHREIPPHNFMARIIRSFPPFNTYFGTQTIHLNTRSLASLWHPPTYRVLTGPHIQRVTSRKAGPPAGIEIFGEEKELEKFL